MAITTFVASQILTAAQMNAVQSNDYNQTVSTKTASYTLVAADKGTRIVMNVASANTVTVNTSLFSAGDTLVIQNIGAGVTTVTAGTATVSSAGPLAIPQNGSGLLYFTSAGVSIYYPSAVTATAGALTLITAQTAFTAVTSVTVDNVFSSTYTNYLVLGRYTTTTTNGLLRMRVGGVAATGSDYNFQGVEGNVSTASSFADASKTSFLALNSTTGDFKSSYQLNFFSPFVTEPTNIQLEVSQAIAAYTATFWRSYRGNHTVSTAYDGFQFAVASGTMTGHYAVYGYAKA